MEQWVDREDERPYPVLLDEAARAARTLLSGQGDPAGRDVPGSFAFVLFKARALVDAYARCVGPVPRRRPPQLEGAAVAEMLDLLLAHTDRLAGGALTGEQLMAGRAGLWERWMLEWPLGSYGRAAAEVLEALGALDGNVLEVGAGVGNASRLVADRVTGDYVRTDLVTSLLDRYPALGRTAWHDVNRPGRWSGLDTVFGVNVLHCALDKPRSLGYLVDMLAPGGLLVLAEGAPATRPGLPWALDFLCGLFAGWWDVGGFASRGRWLGWLQAAGLQPRGYQRLVSAGHDLGGVLVARKP